MERPQSRAATRRPRVSERLLVPGWAGGLGSCRPSRRTCGQRCF